MTTKCASNIKNRNQIATEFTVIRATNYTILHFVYIGCHGIDKHAQRPVSGCRFLPRRNTLRSQGGCEEIPRDPKGPLAAGPMARAQRGMPHAACRAGSADRQHKLIQIDTITCAKHAGRRRHVSRGYEPARLGSGGVAKRSQPVQPASTVSQYLQRRKPPKTGGV